MSDILSFIQQHILLVTALIIALIMLMIIEFIKQKTGSSKLSVNQAIQLINHENACILDVRSNDAFLNGHIIDAQSIPYKDLTEKYKKLEKFKAAPIVVVCTAGIESAKAAIFLTQQGFRAYSLGGGIRAWSDANMPLIKK